MAEITVEDNGPGFQRELIGQVFDPYVTTKAKGTGLGLAIVRKIVEEHGGHIEAENRAEGGARVRIDLPVHRTARSRAAAQRSERKVGAQERACMSTGRILVVDDEADIRDLVQEILTEEGYAVDDRGERGRGARRVRDGRRPTWCCSTSGCPTPTASACCANGSSRRRSTRRS